MSVDEFIDGLHADIKAANEEVERLDALLGEAKDALRDCVPYVNRVRIETDQPWRRETATTILDRVREVLEGG